MSSTITISEYQKDWYKKNKEKKKEINKKYNLKKRDELKKQYKCECGGNYTHQQKSTHFKTKKHLRYLLIKEMINNITE